MVSAESVISAEKNLKSLSRKILIVLPILFALGLVVFASLRSFNSSPYSYSRIYSMNTIIDIKVWGKERNAAVKEITDEINHLNALFDDFSAQSDVGKINVNAGVKEVQVSSDTISVLKEAQQMYKMTNSNFNVCIAPISNLWGFKGGNYRVPTAVEIQNTLKLTDINDLKIAGNNVYLGKKGEAVDLGGIAKGYALDKIMAIIKQQDVNDALINMGGNILTYSTDSQKIWKVGIKDPRGGGVIGTLSISGNKFIATSGDYERFFIDNGVRYCHIFDPLTGKPANKIVSITVISDKGYVSDVLSTAFFVAGKTQAFEIAAKLGVSIIGFDESIVPFYSDGLTELLQLEKR